MISAGEKEKIEKQNNETTQKYCLRTSLSGWALLCTGCLCTGFFCSREGREIQMGVCLEGFGGRDVSAFRGVDTLGF